MTAGASADGATDRPAPSDASGAAEPGAEASYVGALRRAALGMGFGSAIAVAAGAIWLYPYYRDDRSLDRIVRVVALDWRDFGEVRARARLEYELDRAGIGMWVRDEDCALSVSPTGDRVVGCAWTADVALPGTSLTLPLSFASNAAIDARGELRR